MNALAVSYQKNEPVAKQPPPVDWPLIWARKFRNDLHALKMTGRGYTPIVRKFVGTIHQHPKHVSPETLSEFINHAPPAEREQNREALSLFFSLTVPVETLHSVVKNGDFNRKKAWHP
jgi:hypothetical protein